MTFIPVSEEVAELRKKLREQLRRTWKGYPTDVSDRMADEMLVNPSWHFLKWLKGFELSPE